MTPICGSHRVPLDWAATQMNLGNALRVLGERESGTGKLTEAVAAYRAALEEFTREVAPQWRDIAQQKFGPMPCFVKKNAQRLTYVIVALTTKAALSS